MHCISLPLVPTLIYHQLCIHITWPAQLHLFPLSKVINNVIYPCCSHSFCVVLLLSLSFSLFVAQSLDSQSLRTVSSRKVPMLPSEFQHWSIVPAECRDYMLFEVMNRLLLISAGELPQHKQVFCLYSKSKCCCFYYTAAPTTLAMTFYG